jgi:hypothetical protein
MSTHPTGIRGEPSARPIEDEQRRLLVVADETIAGDALITELRRHANGHPLEVKVVAPALVHSPFKLAAGEVDEAIGSADDRVRELVRELERAGIRASGEVGEADPVIALVDGLRDFAADEVVIATRPLEQSAWLEKDVVERARHDADRPITHVVVDPAAHRIESEETFAPADPHEAETGPDYLPPLRTRDQITLPVGIVGTIVLGILALVSDDPSSFAGAARILIAIGAFMITLWHSVALLFFSSVGYRGRWATIAADTVLYGVPLAVVVSLAIG